MEENDVKLGPLDGYRLNPDPPPYPIPTYFDKIFDTIKVFTVAGIGILIIKLFSMYL
jgi:hypothetical protein